MSQFENSMFSAMAVSASGMRAQAGRLRYVSENIANADTPGYHRKLVQFAPVMEAGQADGTVALGPTQLDTRPLSRIFDPGNPLADDGGYYNGSNVDLVVEIADAREAQRSYDANLRMFDQARKMSSSLLQILRR